MYTFYLYRQPEFCDWAFNLRRGEQCLEKWDLIPEGIDILITHGPPIGHGDLCSSKLRAGEYTYFYKLFTVMFCVLMLVLCT